MLLVLSKVQMDEYIQVTKKMRRTNFYLPYCLLVICLLCLVLLFVLTSVSYWLRFSMVFYFVFIKVIDYENITRFVQKIH